MTKRKTHTPPPADKTFYSETFTPDELARVAAFVADPSLDDELWMQRVLNLRLFQLTGDAAATGDSLEPAVLVKMAEALIRGTGRVARLLRDKRALSGQSANGLTGALANALDELATELGLDL